MKTLNFKNTIRLITFCIMLISIIIITKNTIKNIKHLYGSEKNTNTALTCFTDLVY